MTTSNRPLPESATVPIPDQIPPTMNMVDYLLTRHLRAGAGDRIALYTAQREWTYAQLDQLVGRAAAHLQALGVAVGDRIILRVPLSPHALAVFLGAIRLGACPIPTSVLLREADFSRILHHSEPKLVVVERTLAAEVATALAAVPRWEVGSDLPAVLEQAGMVADNRPMAADDLAYMLYTSGSTGEPKGVMRAHRVLLGSAPANVGALMALTAADVCYQPHQDLSFSYPLGHGVLFPLLAGAAAVIEPARPAGRLDPVRVWDAVERYRVTVFSGVPGVYRRLWEAIEEGGNADWGRRVRLWITAGEPLPIALAQAWQDRFGHPIHGSLGQSEVPSFVGHLPGRPIKPGSLGVAFPGVPVAVVDDDGRPCADGTTGNLAIGAAYPGLCSGYFRMPERWQAVCHDGWYYTQDLAYRDSDGYFWHQGRADELIKVRGYSVTPAEVETALEALPAVAQAGVVGLPDPQWGTAIWAFVVERRPGALNGPDWPQALQQALRERLSSYKIPRVFRKVNELPLTDSGKLKRRTLREWARQAADRSDRSLDSKEESR